MYEYNPELPKKRERLISVILLLLGVALFVFSQVKGIPFPIIYQLLALAALTAFIILLSRYLMRRYTYRIMPRSHTGDDLPPDFVVTEYYGRRITVVCRVSVDDVEEIVPIAKENRREWKSKQGGRFFYDYTADLFSKNRFLIVVTDGEHRFTARILADETLLRFLKKD